MDKEDIINNSIAMLLGAAILVFFCLLVLGCSSLGQLSGTTTPPPAPNVTYKFDIKGTVNGVAFDGVGVVPYSTDYQMNIVSRVDVDMLLINSCHRSIQFPSAIELGWFDKKRGFAYDFQPNEMENNGSCLVKISSLNKDSNTENAWAILDFQTPESTLPSTQQCNGDYSSSTGVSICQSKTGLVESIKFTVPVEMASSAPCPFTTKDNYSWKYQIADGVCVVDFHEIASPHRKHRHTSVGFNAVQIRNVQ